MSARGRHYEFAERGREIEGVSAGRTHGSAPTVKYQGSAQTSVSVSPLGLPLSGALNGHHMSDHSAQLLSHRRGGPMCPPAVDTVNLLQTDAKVSFPRKRTYGASTAIGNMGRESPGISCH